MQRIAAILAADFGIHGESISDAVLRAAVRDRMQATGTPDVEAYVARLTNDEEERQQFLECVVVPETWFFRNPEGLRALVDVASTWRTEHPGSVLRILSVPCATGEEPFSIAIALADAGFQSREVQIDAIDVSRRSLAKAERAVYGRNSFRGDGAMYGGNYWRAWHGGLALIPEIRAWVRFAQGNLAQQRFQPPSPQYEVIFCRNVLIYFDRDRQHKVIDDLSRLLAPDGCLFVGPAEALLAIDRGFSSAGYPMAFAFRKLAAERRSLSHANAVRRAAFAGSLPGRTAASALPALPEILASRRAVAPAPAAPAPLVADKALDRIRELADAGNLADAASLCARYVHDHATSSDGWYLRGLIHDALGDLTTATDCYRKTMFLDPSHAEATIHLRLVRSRRTTSGIPSSVGGP